MKTSTVSKQKIWQLAAGVKEGFLRNNPRLSRLTGQLLFNRGIVDKNDIAAFFETDPDKLLHDPKLFRDMEIAVKLVIKHIKAKNKITVYGDYDADGVTAAAIMYETISVLNGKAEVYLPDRVSEGYGLNRDAVEQIASEGTGLIITVDSGIRNAEEAALVKKLGMDIIITDHHVPATEKNEIPDCLIINPMTVDDKYPFRLLAGVGVSFKVASALVNESTLSANQKESLIARMLDLVAIGTVADCVALFSENRALVKKGLAALNRTRRIGLRKLIESARINNSRELDSWNIGFQIAPRLNAAGRMDHANTAFELLVTKDEEEAKAISSRLNSRNIERQQVTEKITQEVEKQVKNDDELIIGVCNEDGDEIWNEGVIGLVAGRISEKFYRPALVITKAGDEYKGSGRSSGDFNLIAAVEAAGEFLEKYGGHAGACGFSLKEENLAVFIKAIRRIAHEKLKGIELVPKIEIEMELAFEDINRGLLEEVELFAPFGQGNERPKFLSKGVAIVDIMNMGAEAQHIKLKLKNEKSGVISAVGFGQAEKWQDLRIGGTIDIVYYVELNEYNGRSEVQLKIVDIRKAEK